MGKSQKLGGTNERSRRKKAIAQKIWDTPFASGNLQVLKKSQLLILVREILNRIGWEYDVQWTKLDIKHLMFSEKCWLITTLDPDFFEKKE